MAWIQVDDTLPTHNKIYDLMDTLHLRHAQAVGTVVLLWLWAASNAPDGDVTPYKPRAIAEAVRWGKSPQALYDALLAVRFLERDGDRIRIRNWETRAAMLMDSVERKKKQNCERVKRYRERNKAKKEGGATVTDNDDVTLCNALQEHDGHADVTLVHAPTKPNHTKPNQLERENARAEEKFLQECAGYYEETFGKPLSGSMLRELSFQVSACGDAQLIKQALMLSHGKQNEAAYFRTVMQNWTGEGIRTYRQYCDKYASVQAAPVRTEKSSNPFMQLLREEEEDGQA